MLSKQLDFSESIHMFYNLFRLKIGKAMPVNLRKISAYVKLLRFDSWQVWLFNFLLGCILFELPQIGRFILVLFSFSLATSAIFILNQYIDRENDRANNLKKDLPIASGDVPPRMGLILFFSFTLISLTSVFLTGISIFLLFLIYMLLGIGYSTPPFSFKNRPVVDVIVCGIGAGILPFFIGLQTAPLLTLQFEFPWMVRRYQDALFTVLPIFLVQSAGQIYQVVGDYEADSMAKISTFAVKYGKKTSLRFATILLLITISLPIIYEFLNLSLTPFLSWYLIAFICLVPCLLYVMKLLQDASERKFKKLRSISRRVGAVILLVLCLYVLIVRMILN
ncbi:MAG TPA: UbiA prenyltransferase family protein [Acidobacteriota bacterium]|nr:UbiA prenyltransferase family protein [Acidobacteriota bacterium]